MQTKSVLLERYFIECFGWRVRSKPNRQKEDWWKTFKTQKYGEKVDFLEPKYLRTCLPFFVNRKESCWKTNKSEFIQKELKSDAIVVENSQMLILHFIMWTSWAQLYTMTSGLTRILDKPSTIKKNFSKNLGFSLAG